MHFSSLDIKYANMQEIQTMIDDCTDVNEKDELGFTFLHYSTMDGRVDIMKALIAVGADVDARGKDKSTALHHSFDTYASGDLIKTLIAAGADVNAREVNGFTPLSLCAFYGHLDDLKTLIAAGADVNTKSEYGITPLHYSAKRGHANVIRELIALGADVNAKDKYGFSPLYYSTTSGCLEGVKSLITAGADVDVKDRFGVTPLHRSAKSGHTDIVKVLIAAGADANVKKDNGGTPLHQSAKVGNADIVEVLITAGADVDAKKKDGSTPLHQSAKRGHAGVVKVLITSGADANMKEKEGKNPLDIACTFKHKETFEVLMKHTMLHTHILNKPKFQSDDSELEIMWSKCEEQVKKLRETFLGESCVSFFNFLTEADENKLALYSSEENFGLNNALGIASYVEIFPFFAEDIEAQFIKGSERACLLHKCQVLMKRFVFKTLPIEIILKIIEYLKNDDLENVSHSLKLKNDFLTFAK